MFIDKKTYSLFKYEIDKNNENKKLMQLLFKFEVNFATLKKTKKYSNKSAISEVELFLLSLV